MRFTVAKKIWFWLAAVSVCSPALTFAQSLTIQGKVTNSAGQPVIGAATKFRVQIYAPDSANHCVLYDETHIVDLSQSYGLFSINLGEVNPARVSRDPPTTYSLEQAISNRAALTVNGTYCSPNVSGVATYVPTSTDNRKVLIQFLDPTTMGTAWETIPEMDLNPVAYAMDARTVGGYPASTVLRVVNASGVPASFPALTSAEAAELQSLAAGTSNKYLAKNATSGVQIPTGAPAAPAAGSIWFDAGVLKYSDGSTVQTLGTGSGTLSSVVGGAGITASVTSGTATVGLAASGVGAGGTVGSATAIPEIQYDTYGRITAVTPHAISGLLPAAGVDHQVLMSNGGAWGASFVGLADLRKDAGTPLFPGTCAANRTLNWNSVSGVFECVDLGSIASTQLAAPTGAAAGTYRSVSVNAAGQVLSGTNPTTLGGYFISDAVRNGGSVPQIRSGAADPSGAGVDGELYVATGSQKIFRYDLGTTTWQTMASAGGAGGTVTGITAGSGIAVSGSAATPTVSLSTTGVSAGSFAKVTTDAYGRVTSGSAQVGDADISDIAFTKLTGKPATLLGHGITENLVTNAGGAASLQAGPTSGRPSPGVAGQIYIDTDTNTVYYRGASSWQTVASAAGSGGTLTEVYSGAGVNVTSSGTTRTVALTDVGTASTGLVKVNTDAKGRVTGGATSIGNAEISDLAFSKLTGTPTTVGDYGITDAVKNTDGTVPNILSGNDTAKPAAVAGNLNFIYIANDTQRIYRQISGAWQVIGAGTTANFSGALAGEVSGTQGATQVDQIGTFLRATILSLFTNVQNATDTKTNSAIVKRDSAGGFAAGAVTADSVVLKGSTSGIATLRAPATVTTYDVQFPATAPTAGQVLSATSGTALTWSTPLSGSTINVAAPITNTSGTIGINTASGSQAGALSSADWTIFNNKLGTALTAASIWVGNASNVATAVAPSGDVGMTSAGAFTVNGIKGQNISAAGASAGQVLRYAGANTWTPNFVSMADLRSTVTGTQAITGNCTASQTLTWNSGSDNLQCQSISIAAATQITGVLPVANGGTGASTVTGPLVFAGPASGTAAPSFRALTASDLSGLANQWAESSGSVNRPSGNVGIGSATPAASLDVLSPAGTNNQEVFAAFGPADAGSSLYLANGTTTDARAQPTVVGRSNHSAYTALGLRGSISAAQDSGAVAVVNFEASRYATDPVTGAFSALTTRPAFNFTNNTTSLMTLLPGGNVGIGSVNPGYGLDVSANNGSLRVIGSTGGLNAVRSVASSAAPDLMLRKSRGTVAAPAIVNDGDYLGHISFGGYDGADYATYPAGIFAVVKGTPAAGSIPSELGLSAGTSGLHPSNERVRITSTGRVGIATTAPQAGLDIATTGTASAMIVPRDTTGNRPSGAAAINGMIRYNTTSSALEAYIGGAWSNLATIGGSSSFTTVGAGAGSAGSPSLSFSGDTNTGFFNTNSDDTISVATGGTKIFDFSSNGLVSPTTGGAAVSSANGTAAAPTYGFAGDAGLGWFRPAAQTLAAATAGVERVRIDSAGRVGIGTTTPQASLHIFRSGGGSQVTSAIIQNTQLASDPVFSGQALTKTPTLQVVGGDSNENWPGMVGIISPGMGSVSQRGPSLNFGASRSTISQLNASTYNPVQSADQLGAILFNGDNTVNMRTAGAYFSAYAGSTWSSTNAESYLTFGTAANGSATAAERLRIAASGNVGIGTSAPLAKLHLQDYSGASQLMLHGNSTTGNKTGVSYRVDATNLWEQYTTSDGSAFNFKLDYLGSNKLLVTPTGNVGIGTTAPATLLHVNSSAANATPLQLTCPSGYCQSASTVNNTQQFAWGASDSAPDSGASGGGGFLGTNSGHNLFFRTNGLTRMTLTPAGNLGVGIADPTVGDSGIDASWRALTVAGPAVSGASIAGLTLASQKTTTANGDRLGAIHFMAPNNSSAISNKYMGIIDTYAEGAGGANGLGAYMRFMTKGDNAGYAERMRITSTGTIGIATSTPRERLDLGGIAFHHGGNLGLQFNQYWNGPASRNEYAGYNGTGYSGTIGFNPVAGDMYFNTSSSSGALGAASNAASRMVISAAGNVGIGTASPANRLDVSAGGMSWNNSVSGAGLSVSDSATPAKKIYAGFDTSTDSGFLGATQSGAGAKSLALNPAGGNVGIGTTNPVSRLEVAGDIRASDGQSLYVGPGGGFNTEKLRIHHIATNSYIDYGTNDLYIRRSDGNVVMTATNASRVGIATTTPSYMLDVNGNARFYGITDSSDERLKRDIHSLENSLERVLRLRAVSYYWKDKKQSQRPQIGLIAQEIEKIFPDLVETDDKGIKSVNYSHLVAPLAESVKALYARITAGEKATATLRAATEAQSVSLEKLAKENSVLKAQTETLREAGEAKARDLASLKARVENSEKENAALKARLDRLEKLLAK